jgi:radical SAM enzyme (TIGR01210 family)
MSIYLNIAPCAWNKCKFCAYEFLKKDGAPTSEEMKKLIDREIEEHVKKGQSYVKIFNGGSWFYNEVPRELREVVYKYMEEINYKKLRVENTFNLIQWDEIKEVIDRGFELTISWGLEAADDRILKEVDKGVTIEKVNRMLVRSKELGIKNLVYVLAGLPTTTIEDYYKTIDWIVERKHLIDEISILTYTPIKGSKYYNELWKTNQFRVIGKEDWKKCREYTKEKVKNTDLKITFTTYNWRFYQGKTYNEVYNKNKK